MTRATLLLGLLGGFIVAMVGLGLAMRPPGGYGDLQTWNRVAGYAAACGAAGVAYAGAVVLVQRRAVPGGLPLVLVLALAMRLIPFSAPPLLSTDLYRYVWDGRVQAAGINPYRFVPADPALAGLRDAGRGPEAIYPNINRADFAPTIYPPAAQALFALLGLSWSSIWSVKAAMLGFDGVAIGAALLLLRAAGRPGAGVLIYAWNPLPVWEFGGGGHIDAAAVALSGLALLAVVRRRPGWAGVALAGAVLMKLLPAALFPALWRRWEWRLPLACGLVIGGGYACYAGAGWRVFGYLPGYAAEEGVGGGGALPLRLLALAGPVPGWAGPAYAAASAAVLLGLAAFVSLRAPLPAEAGARAVVVCRDALLLGTAMLVVLSPHYPWYLAGLALPAVLAPVPGVLWLTLAAPVLYLDWAKEDVVWPSVVFIPFVLLLAHDMLRRRPGMPMPIQGG